MSSFKIAMSKLPQDRQVEIGGFARLSLFRHEDEVFLLSAAGEILTSIIAHEGDVLRVGRSGQRSTLTISHPPSDPTAAALWRYGFTARQRARTLGELGYSSGAAPVWRVGSFAQGYELEGGRDEPERQGILWRSTDGRIGLRLRRTWEGRRGHVPGGYFVADDVTPEEAEAYLVACGRELIW